MLSQIAERWNQTVEETRPPNPKDAPNLLVELIRTYSHPKRHYHNLGHLQHCFEVYDTYMAKLPGTASIQWALWYHDYWYVSSAKNNETLSASAMSKALQSLGFDSGFIQQTVQLVLATSHTRAPVTREAKVTLDVDLAILGELPETYDVYEAAIRREYKFVPLETYCARRADVLQRFLERDWIYATSELRNSHYEDRARHNLSRAIRSLSVGAPVPS